MGCFKNYQVDNALGDFQVMILLLTPPRKMRMIQRCRRLGSRPGRWFDASVASGKWWLARCSLKAKIWRWYFVEPGGVGGGWTKIMLYAIFWYFQECKRSEHVAILVVRTRKRQVRRVEKEMETTQRCHFCLVFYWGRCWLRVKVFHVHKKTGSHLFLPTMSPLWCQLNELNLAAVSAKPRSFSFATQLHTTSPPFASVAMSVLFVFRLAALVTPLVLGEPLLSDGLVVRLQRVPGNGTHFYVGRPEYFYWRGMERTVGLWLLVGWSNKNLARSWPDHLSDTESTTLSTSSKYLISSTSKPSPTKRQRSSLSTFSTFEVACEILFNINSFWNFNLQGESMRIKRSCHRLSVGEPKQSFSVLFDTASGHVLFPCLNGSIRWSVYDREVRESLWWYDMIWYDIMCNGHIYIIRTYIYTQYNMYICTLQEYIYIYTRTINIFIHIHTAI